MGRKKNPNSVVLDRLSVLETRIARLEENQEWMNKILMRIESRMWALITGVIISVISAIMGAVLA